MEKLLSFLGVKKSKGKLFHCFNQNAHKNNDNKASLSVYNNRCYCFACGFSGNAIDVVKHIKSLDYKEAKAFLENRNLGGLTKQKEQVYVKPEIKEISYKKEIMQCKINDYLHKYNDMSKAQKYKSVLTYIYRYSLMEKNHCNKKKYYEGRKLFKNNDIGYISNNFNLQKKLLSNFPIEDLIEFKIFNENGKIRINYDVAVVPLFEINTNICNGLMIRNLFKSTCKEINFSNSLICPCYPYNFANAIRHKSNVIYVCEGHIDALSLIEKKRNAIGLSGAFNFNVSLLSYLKGKTIVLALDNDEAGIAARKKIREKLQSIEATVVDFSWSNNSKDINELLVNNALNNILPY